MKIGDVLVQRGLITEDQLGQALAVQKISKRKLGEILIEKAMITEQKFLEVLAEIHQIPLVSLDNITVDAKLLGLFPTEMLQKNCILPLEIKDQVLIVATNDPLNVLTLQDMRYASGYQIKPVLASIKEITHRLTQSHGSMETFQAIRNAQSDQAQETPIIKLVNTILSQSIKEGASDVHLEPQASQLRVRFRIDGMLFQKQTVPKTLYRKVISRLKIMAGMDVAENRKPQDGRMSWKEGDQTYDIRVATLLDKHGEAISLRILNKKAISHTFDSLGMDPQEMDQIKELIRQPHGILLVTGPTGAGKTTTLYSVLNALNQMTANIITVEDPVEYQLEGITQTSINPFVGYSFANAIRHILRHDPDIIMVGEIRDVETAQVSVRAALTGHLVLATLHTNSAAGAITRLQEMSVEPFLLSSTVLGVIAQRLVRRLCAQCKTKVQAAPDVEANMLAELPQLSRPIFLSQAVGCEQCFQTGYSGRVGLFEILKVTPAVRNLIVARANEQDITKVLVEKGMHTLRMAGFKKVAEQATSYEEILRVTLTE